MRCRPTDSDGVGHEAFCPGSLHHSFSYTTAVKGCGREASVLVRASPTVLSLPISLEGELTPAALEAASWTSSESISGTVRLAALPGNQFGQLIGESPLPSSRVPGQPQPAQLQWVLAVEVLDALLLQGCAAAAGCLNEALSDAKLDTPLPLLSQLGLPPRSFLRIDTPQVLVSEDGLEPECPAPTEKGEVFENEGVPGIDLPVDNRGRSIYVEKLPTPTPSPAVHPSMSPSMPSSAKADPAHPGRLPAVGDPVGTEWKASHLLAHQRRDPFIRRVYDSKLENALGLRGDPDVGIRRFAERCVFDKLGLLCLSAPARTEGDMAVRLRIVLPTSREGEVFRNYHDRCGHLGVNATVAIIARRFYVRNLSKKVRDWIGRCGVCARNAQPRVAAGEATVPYRGSGPGQSYTADVYTTGYECDGYDHIFVIVDDFTGWLRAIPIQGPGDAATLLRLWKYEVTRNESLAVVIKSDRGSNLVAKLYEAYCDCYQISRRDGASGNHHSAATAERLLQTLNRFFRRATCPTTDILNSLYGPEKGWWVVVEKA